MLFGALSSDSRCGDSRFTVLLHGIKQLGGCGDQFFLLKTFVASCMHMGRLESMLYVLCFSDLDWKYRKLLEYATNQRFSLFVLLYFFQSSLIFEFLS